MSSTTDGKPRILLVDDEVTREMRRGYLTDNGYTVDVAIDVPQAVSMIRAREYDVIITEIRISGMSGIDVLRIAKEKHPETEVLILTDFDHESDAIDALRQGAYDYLRKPCTDLRMISFMVRQMIQGQRLRASEKLIQKGGRQ